MSVYWISEVSQRGAIMLLGGVTAIVTIVLLVIVWTRHEEEDLIDQARGRAIARCEQDPEQDHGSCASRIDASHRDCGDISLVRPQRYSQAGPQVDDQKYYRCATLGFAAFQEARRQEREHQQREEQEYLR